jgi:hypothetical protein
VTSGLLPYVAESSDASGVLTREDFEAAAEKLRNMTGVDPCKRGAHIVTARALYKTGTYRCGACGVEVEVAIPLSEAL